MISVFGAGVAGAAAMRVANQNDIRDRTLSQMSEYGASACGAVFFRRFAFFVYRSRRNFGRNGNADSRIQGI
jgi:hypothetical protein